MASDLVCMGDNTVDVYVDQGVMYPGGNAVNVAVHASRLGACASYIGQVGADSLGGFLKASVEQEGVDLSRLRQGLGDNAHAIVRHRDGDRFFEKGSPGVSGFSPDMGDLEMCASSKIVHTGDCSLLEEHLDTIRKYAPTLSFDFAEQEWEYIVKYGPLVDLAIVSRPLGRDPRELAGRVLALGPSQVVVSSGAQGALWCDGERVFLSRAEEASVVDTLGAGDSLIARILVGLLQGEAPEVFMAAATAYATACCMQQGAFGHGASIDPLVSSLREGQY